MAYREQEDLTCPTCGAQGQVVWIMGEALPEPGAVATAGGTNAGTAGRIPGGTTAGTAERAGGVGPHPDTTPDPLPQDILDAGPFAAETLTTAPHWRGKIRCHACGGAILTRP